MFLPTEKLAYFKIILGCITLPRRGFGTPGHVVIVIVNSKISSRSLKNKTKQEQNGDREQASNSERTEVKRRISEFLSDGSQICLKTSEITSTYLTV